MKISRTLELLRGKMTFGVRSPRVYLAAGTRVRRNSFAQIHLGSRVQIQKGVGIAVFGTCERPAKLTIGSNVSIGPRSRINCCEEVSIGDGSVISWDVDILDTDFHQIVDADGFARGVVQPVHIGARVWIGLGAKILKGAEIGDGSVVAAGAVVTRAMPSNSLIAGVPARVIRPILAWRP